MKPKNCFEVFSTKTNTIRVWRKKTSLRRALAAVRNAICHFLRDSSCCIGTALDRPKEYGPHWGGFADRYGMRKTGIVTGNAIEAGAGLFLREDPRYFRLTTRPLKSRFGNVVRLTFAARGHDGGFEPAYARYVAIFGSSFLSNTWRVHSEANTHDALLRASEGFAGRLVANAFAEFWPDIRRLAFRKRD
jgi:hypothetical protein